MLGVVGLQWQVHLHGFFYNSGFFDNLITSNYCKQVTVRLKAILKIIVKWVAYEIPRNQETRIIIINRKHLQDWAVLQSQFVRWAIGFVAWEPCFVEPSIRDFKSHRNNLFKWLSADWWIFHWSPPCRTTIFIFNLPFKGTYVRFQWLAVWHCLGRYHSQGCHGYTLHSPTFRESTSLAGTSPRLISVDEFKGFRETKWHLN